MAATASLKTNLVELRRSLPATNLQELSTLLLLTAVYRLNSAGHPLAGTEDSLAAGNVIYDRTNQAVHQEIRNILPRLEHAGGLVARAAQWVAANERALSALGTGVFGYIYQLYCLPQRSASQRRTQTANKASIVSDVIAFTQLYTPEWVVQFLLDETVVSQWSGAKNRQKLATGGQKLPAEKSLPAGALTMLDPACGAGNFLLPAFDLLVSLHEAEGIPAAEAGPIAINNLYGCDIDPIALWVSALALTTQYAILCKSFPAQPLNLRLVLEPDSDGAPLGTLHREWDEQHALSRTFQAVVGNPPYIGRKLLSRALKEKLKASYPDTHSDLCAAFAQRGLELLDKGGRLGFITQASLLYLPSYEKFRKRLLEDHSLVVTVDAGTKVFPLQTGEKVNSILLVVQKGRTSTHSSLFIDLTQESNKGASLANPPASCIYVRRQQEFKECRATAFNYRLPRGLLKIQNASAALQQHVDIRQGLATTDNARFVKWWWQVPPTELGRRWFPYVKGAGSERWLSPIETVVDWGNDGEEIKRAVAEAYPYLNGKTAWVVKNEQYYRRNGLTFSFVNTKQLAIRYLPPGCIFDVAGSALFPYAEAAEELWLAYLNSSLVMAAASMLNPTINFQVGDLRRLPVLVFSDARKQRLQELGRDCLERKRRLLRFEPTNYQWQEPEEIRLVKSGADPASTFESLAAGMRSDIWQLAANERDIDRLVLNEALKLLTDAGERLQIEQLCQREAAQRKSSYEQPLTAEQFAHVVLSSAVNSLQSMTIARPEDLSQALHVSGNFLNWSAAVLGMPIGDYLRGPFSAAQNKQFHKAPPVVMNISDQLLIFHPPLT